MPVTPFRLPADLLKRLDAHAKRLQRRNPGLRVTRADAVRQLLLSALEAEEANDGTTKA